MKQAMGDLNGTVIVLAAVALLSAVFFSIIWPMVKQGLKDDARCADAVCDAGYTQGSGMVDCYMPDSDSKTIFECPYRG